MAYEIPSTIRLRSLSNVKPFTSVFDRPGIPVFKEEQFRGVDLGTPISPVGYRQPPRQEPGIIPSITSPAGQALGAAATTGLQLSGWQDRPITLGQGLGAMAQAGMQAYTAAQAAERDRRLQELTLGLKIAESQKPDLTNAERLAFAMGFKRGTPEFNDFIMRSATKPETQIFMGGDKQKEMAYGAALETRKQMQKLVGQDRELAARLQTAIDLIKSGAETGRIQSAMLPIKQIARELGLLSDKQISDLGDQEIIASAAAFLTPRMRVVGSGASSDRDMGFFERATVRLANTPEANLVIATMQKQVMNYNMRRLNLFDKYIQEKGHDFGFGEFADEQMGSVYQRVENDAQFTEFVDSGKIRDGDVFFNGITGEFDIYDPEEMK